MKNYKWWELIIGFILVTLGIYTLTMPNSILGSVVIIYGIVAILRGILDIGLYVKLEKRTGWGPSTALVSGIFSSVIGVLLLLNIEAGKFALTLLFTLWFIAHCISRLANLPFIRLFGGKAMYWFSLVLNILGIFLGATLFFNPFRSALALSIIIGVYLVAIGIENIVLFFSGKE